MRLGYTIAALTVVAGAALSSAVQAQTLPQVVAASRGTIFQVGQFASALATINGGFFNQNNAFVSSPGAQTPDQFGAGIWVRATGGTFDTSVTGVLSGPVPSTSARVRTFSDYSGLQASADVARYNLGDSGYTMHLGVTGGQVNIRSTGPDAPGEARFAVPFVGGYMAITGHGFFFDALVRGDFFELSTGGNGFRFNTTAITGATSIGYRIDLPDFYIVPSAAFSYTSLEGGSQPTAAAGPILPGTISLRTITSELGRINLTVGKDVQVGDFVLSPFVTASVFNEFAAPASITFNGAAVVAGPAVVPLVLNGTLSRVGTYGQFSIGSSMATNVSAPGGKEANLLGFVRADFRVGDHADGYGVSGGLRYQF
ncbi:autotransporter outer membrane beta-barrel domain-containing protein [Micromonospora sp. STR1s_5]|nr:autotransporter outer membrane beta-barrel domain-containing protein [Micromonospora sp. STR1s_5]